MDKEQFDALERARRASQPPPKAPDTADAPQRRYAVVEKGQPKLITEAERVAMERARLAGSTPPTALDNPDAPTAGGRRRYAVVENGQPRLVTDAERAALERARPKSKSFMEDVIARYVVPVRFAATGGQSWFRHVFVGAGSRRAFRRHLLRILRMDRQGPLSRALLRNDRLLPGGVAGQGRTFWAQNPNLIQAGHVLSDNAGGPQLLIVMSAHHNQRFANNLEARPVGVDKPGQLLIEDAYVIQGVAVHRDTAHDLVGRGLDQSVLDNADIIRFTY